MPGALAGLNCNLGSLKHLPPTLSPAYYPMAGTWPLQPYVGAGINYTWFFDSELSCEAEAKGIHGFDLDNSWGLAVQIGIDVMLSDRLLLNVQARYIDIDTAGTIHLAGDKVKVDLEVDPFVYMVGLGYRF
jgi:outer membrane protein